MAENDIGKVRICGRCGRSKKIVVAFSGYEKSRLCEDCALGIYPCDFCEKNIEISSYKKHLMDNHSPETMADKLASYKLAGYSL